MVTLSFPPPAETVTVSEDPVTWPPFDHVELMQAT
jgi:hypothetical protein